MDSVQGRGLEWSLSILQITVENGKATWFDYEYSKNKIVLSIIGKGLNTRVCWAHAWIRGFLQVQAALEARPGI